MTNFADIGLRAPILRAVEEGGYKTMTPIQAQAIPVVLEGKDLIGLAQTGTGKTAAFSLPILQLLLKGEGKRQPKTVRSLILAPTRELAVQIGENIDGYSKYLHFKKTMIFGGVSDKPQIKAMQGGVDILIATPGRLLDLVNQGHVKLGSVEILVLDEADRMLDMGFIRDIKKIIAALPKKRQNILFSATMPKTVEGLAGSILNRPERIQVAPVATTAEKIEQHVLMVPKAKKKDLLAHVLKDPAIKRVLVFTRTKHGANKVSKYLEDLKITSAAIHGNKSQNARQKALQQFRDGDIRALVATDVAARGIDVDGVTHVINFELPNEPESYVHRIGRTARAGATGISLSFCEHEEREYLVDIEKTIRKKIQIMFDHPFHKEGSEALFDEDGREVTKPKPRQQGRGRRSGSPKSKGTGEGAAPAKNKRRRSGGKPGGGRPQGRPSSAGGAGKPGGGKPGGNSNHRSRPANRGSRSR